ncbi:MAG: TonB-dependent receptor [Asticcacaulis sp.]
MRYINRAMPVRALLATVALTALSAGVASAQQSDESESASDANVTEVVVTGSRIRGVAPVGSNLISVTRDEFTKSAAVSTAELFKDVPQAINIGVNETNRGAQGGSGNITYVNSVNLRGIGPSATLTLLDGHRLPGSGTGGAYSDTSVVPILALRRMEIIADGASAIYGSDAVAGVVNLILRRDLNGVEANARYGVADGYDTRQFGVAAGKTWSTGQFMATFEHSYHSALRSRDRDFIVSDQREMGGPDFRVTNCNPGNIIQGGVSYAIPEGGITAGNAGSLVGGTSNRCDLGQYVDVIPEIEKNGLVLTFTQELAPGLKIVGDAFYYKREFLRNVATSAQVLTVPRSNAFFVDPTGTNPASHQVQYYFGKDYGLTTPNLGESETYQGTVALHMDFNADWKGEVSYSAGYNKDTAYNYGIYAAGLTAALASSNTATAFNPYGGTNSQAVIDTFANGYVSLGAIGGTGHRQLQFKTDGPLFSLPAGQVRLALGVEHITLTNKNGSYTGWDDALTGRANDLSRNIKSGYFEVLIPVFSEANAIPGFRRLDINIAGRYDEYSDVGATRNPKVGINWVPVNGLTLTGSYGTSFRAPNLGSLVSSNPALTVQNFVDPESSTGYTQGYAWSEGNPNLKPETAETWSVGADIRPPALPGLGITVSYFNVKYENQISNLLGNLTALQYPDIYGDYIIRNPSQALVDELTGRLRISGVPLTTVPVIVDARSANMGVTEIDGVDFNVRYNFSTDNYGDFRVGVNGIWYNSYKVAQTPTADLVERLGLLNYPVEYRLRANATWTYGDLTTTAYVSHVPSYKNDSVNPAQTVDSWTTADLNLSYAPAHWEGILGGTTLDVNITNLFDQDPPYAALAPSTNQSGGFDVQNANPLGRLITFGITKRF